MKQQFQIAFYVGALLLVVAMTGCTAGKSKEMNIELIQDMMDQARTSMDVADVLKPIDSQVRTRFLQLPGNFPLASG